MTAITINIPDRKVSFFKKLIAEMGWTYEVKEEKAQPKAKAHLYDPETGEYLNDKTMKAIEDVRSGKEPVYEMKSMDEFKAWCESLGDYGKVHCETDRPIPQGLETGQAHKVSDTLSTTILWQR